MQERGKRDIPEKTHRPGATFGTIPSCENPGATPPPLASHQREPGSLADFRMWESCRTMLLVDGFSQGSPVSLAPSIWLCSIFHLGSTSLALKFSVLRAAPNLLQSQINCAHENLRLRAFRGVKSATGRLDYWTGCCDQKHCAQVESSRLAAMGHLIRVAASPLSPPRFSASRPEERSSEEIWVALGSEVSRADEGEAREYGAAPQCMGDPRENPPISGIVRRDYHMRKSWGDPAENRTRVGSPSWEASRLSTIPQRPQSLCF
ncbi:hypothetical protein PR048_027214 [Dryococelus australis]|uniref:Uncharacterized protein n=1 Tax=Dryococelus australis TaxID=614101 RepID=A0ABQ9GGB7_9NEOP|nr:hypothetical protein PR048_027214 [Dryococelus australis]